MTIERDLHLDDDRCAEIALSLSPERERVTALAHAARCEACAERLRSHVAASVRARADEPHAQVRALVPARRPRRSWLLLPAAAALVAASVWLPRAIGPRTTREASRLPSPTEALLPRGVAPLDPRLAAGFDAHARGDLEGAVRELSAAKAEGGAEQARRLYLADALLARGEHEQALVLLRSLEFTSLPVRVSREAAALLARALRASGARARADSLERRLRETPEWVPVHP